MKNLHFKIVKRAPLEAIVSLYREAGWWKEKPRARAVIPGMIKGSFCFLKSVFFDLTVGYTVTNE